MGNICQGSSEELAKSRKFDEALSKTSKELKNETKLLLLGPGESGKSTIVKQLRIINEKWISDEERMGYRSVIHSNTILSMSALVKALQKSSQIDELDDDSKENAVLLTLPETLAATELTQELTDAIKMLWDLNIVKERFKTKSDVQIIDSAAYFFDNLSRISESKYVPTDQDILFSRTRTTGITEFCFNLAGTPIRLVDVGGQRSERRKWIHCFDEVTSIFFIVAISEFDQKLREDESTNRLTEAFHLFKDVCAYETFASTPVILFLNKSDLFEEKLKRVKISDYFPEYTGPNDLAKIYDWLKGTFQDFAGNKKIYSHVTNATNTENVETVFGAVQHIFLEANIQQLGV